jgi:hypothetical protein
MEEDLQEKAHEAGEPWIMGVALTAAIVAALAAVTALMAEHHANEAMIEQVQSSDQWGFYQAKSIKANLLNTKMELLAAQGKTASAKDLAKIEEYKKEQEEIQEKAKEKVESSEAHLRHHTVLSRSLTLLQVAIAVSAISALTRRKLFWFVSLGFGLVGLILFVWGVVLV